MVLALYLQAVLGGCGPCNAKVRGEQTLVTLYQLKSGHLPHCTTEVLKPEASRLHSTVEIGEDELQSNTTSLIKTTDTSINKLQQRGIAHCDSHLHVGRGQLQAVRQTPTAAVQPQAAGDHPVTAQRSLGLAVREQSIRRPETVLSEALSLFYEISPHFSSTRYLRFCRGSVASR